MFSALNEKYQKSISDIEDEKLIMEAITGSDMDPSIEAAAEDEVDVYSVPRKDLDKLDKFADKLVSSADYDDDDLDDLLDDGYEDAIIVAEASVTTPSGDKPGDYNSGIKSGQVDYDMNDCEDRGGVGVNSVIARNDQLSESILAMNFELNDMLCEAAADSKKGRVKNVLTTIGNAIMKAGEWVLKQLRKLGALIAGPFKKAWAAITKAIKNRKGKKPAVSEAERNEKINKAREASEKWQEEQEAARKKFVQAKQEAEEEDAYKHVNIQVGIYNDKQLLSKAAKAATASGNYAAGKLRSFRNANVSAKPVDTDIDKIIKLVEAVDYDTETRKVGFDEYHKICTAAKFDPDSIKKIVDEFGAAAQKFTNIKGFLEAYYRQNKTKGDLTRDDFDNVDADDYQAQEKITQAASSAYSTANAYAVQLRSVNRAMAALTSATKKLNAIVGIHAKNTQAIMEKLGFRNSAAGLEIGKRIKDKESSAKNESVGNVYTRAYKFVNESCIGGFQSYFDEATGEYFFGFELEEAAGNSTTYEEFKENLKTDGTLKVEAPKVEARPKDDMSKRDPAQPGLTNEVSLAKNSLCKAYTADQMACIPASKMGTVRNAITDMIATKSAAIASLKEAYEAHIGDSYEVRAAILEDAAMIRKDLDNLKHNLALTESSLDIDSLAESVFGDSFSDPVDEAYDDWSFLYEDSETDLDDLDLGEDDDKDDKKDKEDKKSDKSDKDKKDDKGSDKKDDEECDDSECEDDDDDKKSKKDDDDKKDKEDKDDEDKEVDESASLLAVIGELMSALD